MKSSTNADSIRVSSEIASKKITGADFGVTGATFQYQPITLRSCRYGVENDASFVLGADLGVAEPSSWGLPEREDPKWPHRRSNDQRT